MQQSNEVSSTTNGEQRQAEKDIVEKMASFFTFVNSLELFLDAEDMRFMMLQFQSIGAELRQMDLTNLDSPSAQQSFRRVARKLIRRFERGAI